MKDLFLFLFFFSFFDISSLSEFISHSEAHIIFANINDEPQEGFDSFKLILSHSINCLTSIRCLRLLLRFLVYTREGHHQIK